MTKTYLVILLLCSVGLLIGSDVVDTREMRNGEYWYEGEEVTIMGIEVPANKAPSYPRSKYYDDAYELLLAKAKRDFPFSDITVRDIDVIITQNYNRRTKAPTTYTAKARVVRTTSEFQRVMDCLPYFVDKFNERLPSRNLRILVTGIYANNDRELANNITQELESSLINRGYRSVINRKDLAHLDAEMKYQNGDQINFDTAVSYGMRSGAEVIIVGELTGRGVSRRLAFRATDIATTELLVTEIRDLK